MKMLQRSVISSMGALDSRSISLCRICLGCLILWDLCQYWQHLEAFLLDDGIVSRTLLEKHYQANKWTLLGWWFVTPASSSIFGTKILLLLHGLCGLAFLTGFKTRSAAVLIWLFTIQIHNRNPYVLQGGDVLLRAILFWFMFLPSGRHFSLDAVGQKMKPVLVTGLSPFFFTAQFALMYLFTWILKDHPAWNSDYTAVYLALHYDQLATPFAVWLRQFEGLLPFFTAATYWTEFSAPILLLLTHRLPRTRLILVIGMILFHIGLASAIFLAHFPWLCAIIWLAFLPPKFWNETLPDPEEKKPSLLLSLKSGFCVLMFAVVIAWNIRTLDFKRHETWFPRSLSSVVQAIRLDQYWSMFSPYPTREDGWFVLTGKSADGSWHDLLRNRSESFAEKPEYPSHDYPNGRWSKLYSLLRRKTHPARAATLDWYQRSWNRENPQNSLIEIRLDFIEEYTHSPPQ